MSSESGKDERGETRRPPEGRGQPDHQEPSAGPGPVLDLFKVIKISGAHPAPPDEDPPESWREVTRRFNRYLMRIVAGLPKFLAETLEGSTRLIRGATMPAAVEQKVFRAHAKSDMLEEQRQQEIASGLEVEGDEAVAKLLALLNKYHAQGHEVRVEKHRDGTILFTVVRIELEDQAAALSRRLPPAEEPEDEDLETEGLAR